MRSWDGRWASILNKIKRRLGWPRLDMRVNTEPAISLHLLSRLANIELFSGDLWAQTWHWIMSWYSIKLKHCWILFVQSISMLYSSVFYFQMGTVSVYGFGCKRRLITIRVALCLQRFNSGICWRCGTVSMGWENQPIYISLKIIIILK